MTDFSTAMFLGTLIIVMNLIIILFIVVKDLKIWAKFDRMVLFLGDERNAINMEMAKMRDSILDLKNNLMEIKDTIREMSCKK